MITLRVGGVPEHFNLPWHLAMEEDDFEYDHLAIEWVSFPGGTGAMNAALRNNEIDVAIILTEGIIKDIIDGNPSKIVQTYVQSPLIWGIHVAANSTFQEVEDLENTKAAISRLGSGSHLMAYINAEKQHWDTTALDFEIVGDIEGAIDALTKDAAQYFMWERFTTKPLVDKGADSLVLGCTHYSYIKDQIGEVLGNTVAIIDTEDAVSKRLANVLKEERLLSDVEGNIKFYSSGVPEHQNKLISRYWGSNVKADVFE